MEAEPMSALPHSPLGTYEGGIANVLRFLPRGIPGLSDVAVGVPLWLPVDKVAQ